MGRLPWYSAYQYTGLSYGDISIGVASLETYRGRRYQGVVSNFLCNYFLCWLLTFYLQIKPYFSQIFNFGCLPHEERSGRANREKWRKLRNVCCSHLMISNEVQKIGYIAILNIHPKMLQKPPTPRWSDQFFLTFSKFIWHFDNPKRRGWGVYLDIQHHQYTGISDGDISICTEV